jgi:hypothetical protein
MVHIDGQERGILETINGKKKYWAVIVLSEGFSLLKHAQSSRFLPS